MESSILSYNNSAYKLDGVKHPLRNEIFPSSKNKSDGSRPHQRAWRGDFPRALLQVEGGTGTQMDQGPGIMLIRSFHGSPRAMQF
jgi:hypothetical protein